MESLKNSIIQLLKGEASRDEASAMLKLTPEKLNAYFNEKEWESFVPGFIPEESVQWYEEIHKRLLPPERLLHWKRWFSIAALLLLIAGVFYYSEDRKSKTGSRLATATSPAVLKEQCVTNHNTTIQHYELPDGSVIELSPASTIRYTNPMETDKRSVWLEGEAVFHVKKDAGRPFTVFTTGLATTALGTVFKVTSFENKKTNVVLISGKISVTSQNNNQVLYLNAGEQCSFDPASSVLRMNKTVSKKMAPVKESITKTSTTATNEIIFNKTPLPEVFRQIETIYQVHIVFTAEPAYSRIFTGSFIKSKTPDEAMETIALLNDLEMKKAGDSIYLRKK